MDTTFSAADQLICCKLISGMATLLKTNKETAKVRIGCNSAEISHRDMAARSGTTPGGSPHHAAAASVTLSQVRLW